MAPLQIPARRFTGGVTPCPVSPASSLSTEEQAVAPARPLTVRTFTGLCLLQSADRAVLCALQTRMKMLRGGRAGFAFIPWSGGYFMGGD